MDNVFKALVLIPSFNAGIALKHTVSEVLEQTAHVVWVIIDGSTDNSQANLATLLADYPDRLKIIEKAHNEGKGAAVKTGSELASQEGFTHALVMDSDGQHPTDHIDSFILASKENPTAIILGQPIFDASVPKERLHGRKLSVWLVYLETLGNSIGDPLYGFRVYPIKPMLAVMGKNRSKRYDFDPEVAVRLNWAGCPSVKIPAPVKYLSKEDGGISHFHYLRDNIRFVFLHTKLILELIVRLPILLTRKPNAQT